LQNESTFPFEMGYKGITFLQNILLFTKNLVKMKRSNVFGFGHSAQAILRAEEGAPAAACGTACGSGDKEAKPAACGSACGSGDKEEKPAACGSACGTGDKK
jgi:ACGX-repeat protein